MACTLIYTTERQIINGNLKDLNLHMDALKKMVTLKGGLQALGMHGVLHMLISWYLVPR